MIRPNPLSLKLLLALILSTTSRLPSQAAEIAVLPGSTAQTQSKMVCRSINWLTTLEDAKKEHKLIVWIHMLGNIDGFT